MRYLKTIVIAIVAYLAMTACTTPAHIAYFQDFKKGETMNVQNPVEIKFKPDDRISIMVSTTEQELTSMFVLGGGRNGNNGTSYSGGYGQRGSEYIIDNEGFIRFPVLGRIHVAGLNRQELQESIREEIIKRNLVKDPIVTVNYEGLYVIVIGDIGTGRVSIDKDKFTLIDAIASQGDLAITGKRTNVKVIRENYGKKTVYEVNLCSAKELYNSPVYYLQQNDVIYVEMNNKQKRNSTVYGNSVVQPSFWVSMVSLAFTVATWFKF